MWKLLDLNIILKRSINPFNVSNTFLLCVDFITYIITLFVCNEDSIDYITYKNNIEKVINVIYYISFMYLL